MSKKNVKGEPMNDKGFKELQNAAKTLFANIRFSSIDKDIAAICVTSTVPNEGKTTTAVALAEAIATAGKTVLLVEGDMRRRNLARALKVTPRGGAYSVLTGVSKLSEVACRTSVPNMYFLDIEPNIPNPADILSSKRYMALINVLKDSFDYVIFDTPPIGTFVDAAIMAALVDGTILVVKQGSTKREEALAAIKQLEQANATVLGCVLTFGDDKGSDYYYAYYTQTKDDKGNVKMVRKK